MADRVRGVQVHRPVVYGTRARYLTPEERSTAPPGHTHRWTVFLASAASPPPKDGDLENADYIPGGADDLSYMIKRVTFKLHDSYTPMSRVFDKPPFQVTETGWGEFDIQIRIQFVGEASEKPLQLQHMLKLHHWGPVIDGLEAPAPSTTLDASSSAAPTPAGVPAATAPSAEDQTNEAITTATPGGSAAPEDLDGKPDEGLREGSASGEVVKTEVEGTTPVPADTIVAIQPNEPRVQEPYNPYVNMAHLPVLSWQYDELVFNDPPAAFFDILNENPPTPLPAKLRRPRDQREATAPAKKQKGRASTVGNTSRAQTQEPGTGGATGPVAPAGGAAHLPGSADVPLEFAKEMESAELNRLTDVKLYVIDQMDTWRTRLIAQEKELAKLKQEMKIA